MVIVEKSYKIQIKREKTSILKKIEEGHVDKALVGFLELRTFSNFSGMFPDCLNRKQRWRSHHRKHRSLLVSRDIKLWLIFYYSVLYYYYMYDCNG